MLRVAGVALVAVLFVTTFAAAQDAGQPAAALPPAPAEDTGWRVEIVPIYVWAPVNVATVTLPSFPDLPPPPGGGDPSGDTDAGLSGAAMAGVRVQKGRWMASLNVAWAGLSASRERPYVRLDGNIIFGEAFTGVRVVDQLWLVGGVRRLAVDVKARVLDYPEVGGKPGYWDPVIGATYRLQAGPRVRITVQGDVGGFDVGSKLDANAAVTLDLRVAGRFGVWVGYKAIYLKFVDRQVGAAGAERNLKLWATLHGPAAGLRLAF